MRIFKIIILISLTMIFIGLLVIDKTSYIKSRSINKMTCEIDTPDMYHTTFIFNYEDGIPNDINLVYKYKKGNIGYEKKSQTWAQIDYYLRLKDVEYKYLNDKLFITLNEDVYVSNINNKNIENIFSKWYKTRKYLETLGYTCKIE